jgi:predicted transcriptional regulator of viral defense system
MHANPIKHQKLVSYIEKLLSKGEITFTKESALKYLGISEVAFLNSALRLNKKRTLVKLYNGFYLIITPEFKKAGSPPPIYFIDDLMKFLGQPYYIGLLSAARHYGATHQALMELQIITTLPLKTLRIGKNRIQFFTNKMTEQIPKQTVKTPQGPVWMSTPEATLFDLIKFYKKIGGFSHIATTISEIRDSISGDKLAQTANTYQDIPLTQRLGFLVEAFAGNQKVKGLQKWLKSKELSYKRLSGNRQGVELTRSDKWKLIIDLEIEVDEI